MKRLLTWLSMAAVALTLSLPAVAKTPAGKQGKKESQAHAQKASKSEGKSHALHAKKKGNRHGKKEGQEGTNPRH